MIHVDETDPVGEIDPPFPNRDVTIKRNTDVKDHFEMLSEIGRGKFGTVYLCREKSTGLELAAKVVSVARRDERRNVEREVEVMRCLRHPRLIQLYDAYEWGKHMCVLLELVTGGELFERVIDEDFVLTERACTVFMRQICEGIEFVHRQNILHLDLKFPVSMTINKAQGQTLRVAGVDLSVSCFSHGQLYVPVSLPENILCLTKTGNRIKIIDFGLARFYDPDKKLQVLFGTPEFVAPEVVNFDQIGYGTDMWSVGVICYVLLSGLSPFMGETDVETMANVTVANYDFDDEAFNEISEDAKDFIRKLLIKDKESRPCATECLRHQWLIKRPSPKKDKPPQEGASPKPALDVAKDNLRVFVERWGEHPNSPYVFDNEAHEIISMADGEYEKSSIGGCSPSPRSSLASSPDVFDEDDLDPPRFRDFKTTRNPVIRRASDSSCFLHKKHDVFVRKNLAEEIKKLSDHLFMLATMNTDLKNNNNTNELDKNVTESKTTSKEETKLPNGFKKESHTSITRTMSNGDTNRRDSKIVVSKSSHKISSSFLEEKDQQKPMTSKMPWAKTTATRSKRLSNSSRDVADQPLERRQSFFEEFDRRRDRIGKLFNCKENGKQKPYRRDEENNAHRTKDLLLHLLEEWDETEDSEQERAQVGAANGTRHQSISLEWSPSNRLAQNSMSSLHAFFKKQTSDGKKQTSIFQNLK